MREGLVLVSVSTGSAPSAESNDATVTLRVEERLSGVVLVDVDLTPAEFWRLIIGSVRTTTAHVADTDEAALIGKQMENDSVKVPKEVYEGVKAKHTPGVYDRDRIEQLDAGKAWAEEHWIDMPEPKHISTRWTNSGMYSYIRFWVAPVACTTCGKFQGDHDYMDPCRKRP